MQTHANAWIGVEMETGGHGLPTGGSLEHLSFEQTLTLLAGATLSLVALWFTVVTLATLVEGLAGVSHATLRALTPALLRRAVLLGCGVAVGAGTISPATAVSSPPAGGDASGVSTPAVLSGLPLPDRAVGEGPRPRGLATVARPEPSATRHRVRPGDSLWSIAAHHLGTSSAGEVEAAWRRIYDANRGVVGDDPDLLTPGSRLVLPADLRSGPPPGDDDASPS